MNISITNISDNQTIVLLAEVLKKIQEEKEEIAIQNKELLTSNDTKDDTIDDLNKKLLELQKSNGSKDGTIDDLNKKLLELQKSNDTKDDTIDDLNKKLLELQKSNDTKDGTIDDLNKKLLELQKSNDTKDGTIDDLNKELQKVQFDFLITWSQNIGNIIQLIIPYLPNEEWQSYLNDIYVGIENFVKENNSIQELKNQLKIKYGWLTKLSSIFWWSQESHVSPNMPPLLNNTSVLFKSFKHFIEHISSLGLKPNLPSSDFSSTIPKYKADYDGGTSIIKNLFPDYSTEGFVLCEIIYLSFNNEIGKCIGIRYN